MKKNQVMGYLGIFLIISTQSTGWAKPRPQTPFKPKLPEVGSTKGVSGQASLQIQHTLSNPQENTAVQIQDGKITEEVQFYKSPRCYLHFKKSVPVQAPIQATIQQGKVLNISKIDNIYTKGNVHVTFWFDEESPVSDLSCITNYDHTLTADELQTTLGNLANVSFTKNIEKEALFNTAPAKNAKFVSEETNTQSYSVRSVLSGS